jgi:predicted transcriptional regulator
VLGTIELAVLGVVDRGDSVSSIAAKLDRSESYVSRAVADLEEAGLVYAERDGRRKRVIPSDARAVEVYRDLVRQHSHVDFPELLTGKALEILYHFDRPMTVADLAERSDNYRNTVNRVLKRLRSRGLVGNESGRYHFNGDFERLHEFARELAHHRHRRNLEEVAPSGTILWESDDEFLAKSETEIVADGFHETGLARFADYDLQFLLTRHRYYFYSDRLETLSPADLCCHTLLIDDGPRYRSYCLLLLSRVDVDESTLRDRATKYGLEAEIDALLRYLETEGEAQEERLPDWSTVQELAAEYEVSLSS